MSAKRLKVFVLSLWGAILVICLVLAGWVLAVRGFRPVFARQAAPAGTLAATFTNPATASIRPGYILLPSATARIGTPVPETATPPPTFSLPILQYLTTPSADTDPLTGLKPANPDLLNRRPIAVKVSSFPRGAVRPVQSGLSLADVVYEYYIEDGLTRFIAVFYSKDASRAGPVRSGRYFDEYVMRMYRSSLVFANADERVEKHLMDQSDLLPLLFVMRPDNCPPLCRDTSILGYNNVFVDTAGVGPLLDDNSRQDLRPTFFASLLYPQGLAPINRIYTHYSSYSYNYWEFDALHQIYRRYSDAADATGLAQNEVYAPHMDQLTGVQLSADNVVVLVVPHNFHNEFDREDQVFDISLQGSGMAFIFRDGRMLKGLWLRDRVDQPIQLVDDKGRAIPLKPGVTFYQVINPESSVKQTDKTMEFFFSIPPRYLTPTPTDIIYVKATPTPHKH